MSEFIPKNEYNGYFDHTATEDLGVPLPLNESHAVSVSLPQWQHVVGYEEGDKTVVNSMISGYPRFRFNNYVRCLMDVALLLHQKIDLKKESIGASVSSCLLLPTFRVHLRFRHFMAKSGVEIDAFLLKETQIHACFFPVESAPLAKKFWQHSGEIISSRVAAIALEKCLTYINHFFTTEELASLPPEEFQTIIRNKLGDISKIDLLHPIGLQAATQPYLDNDYSTGHGTTANSQSIIKERLATIINYDKPPYLTSSSSSHNDCVLVQESDIQLTICGMAAIFTAFRIVRTTFRNHPNTTHEPGEIVVFGFPYLDTLKIMSRTEWHEGKVHFLGVGNEEDYQKLEEILQLGVIHDGGNSNKVMGIFTEMPSNPLMKCPDLRRLTTLANQYHTALVVDDTIGNIANLNLFDGGSVCIDMLVTSLTKIFSGVGDVMAGSIILNPNNPRYLQWKATLEQMNRVHDIPSLCEEDCVVLEKNSRLFLHRSTIINRNALHLATWLQSQTIEVKCVHYPGLHGLYKEIFDHVKRPNITLQLSPELPTVTHEAGYGCLLSLEVHDCVNVQVFYDELKVNKGPSLGTDFTLVCPYTLLAHYTELDWAESFGISGNLIRVSVGTEEIESLIGIFRAALDRARCL